ncbi:uncharacterized protein EI90DRAFT_3151929 [Cantharellus anzutake]|uniref:uncharacterized protein n=1 Tax=Cantharellus anzutake TaxID=1750568 RepID=UPI00190335E7|nr:uncharacterized protein EI90DRAFT_3151929 [Cantharellus anzutake]KAF8338141.1 hypothetical protein EI90DRAFT_3151929 [Cantharellus anzutake]
MSYQTPSRDQRQVAGPSRPRAASRSTMRPSTEDSTSQLPTHMPNMFQPRVVRGTVPHSGASIPPSASQYASPMNGLSSSPSPGGRPPRTRRPSSTAVSAAAALSSALSTSPPPGPGSAGSLTAYAHPSSSPASSMLHPHRKSSAPAASISGSFPLGSHAGSLHALDSPISFTRPSYLEHSALRRYIQITPYAPYTPLYTQSHHATAASNSNDSATRQRRSSLARRLNPVSSARTSRMLLDDTDDDMSEDDDLRIPPTNRRPSTSAQVPTSNGTTGPSGSSYDAAPEQVFQLPTRWNREDRSPSVNVSSDGREVHFNGVTATADKDAAAIRANHPMPRACGIYYYEVEIISKGHKGHIGIGFGTRRVSLSRLPGWAQPNWQPDLGHESWGYHGDDGRSFASQDTGSPYGQKFSTGDVIGCGVDFVKKQAFYTKNGAFQGYVFNNVDGELFPMVGLRTQGEAVKANFGHAPFKFDIESFVHLRRNEAWAEIQSTNVDFLHTETGMSFKVVPTPSQVPTNQIVLDYLSHHGFGSAARALKKSIEAREALAREIRASAEFPSSSALSSRCTAVPSFAPYDSDGIDARQRIMSAVLSGDVDFAMEETRKRYPTALEVDGGWMLFRLRCRKFVELLLEASAALKIAKKMEAYEIGFGEAVKDIVPAKVTPRPVEGVRSISTSIAPSIPPKVSEVTDSEQGETAEMEVHPHVDADAMEVDEVPGLDGVPFSMIRPTATPLSTANGTTAVLATDGTHAIPMSQKAREKQPERLMSLPILSNPAPSCSTEAVLPTEQKPDPPSLPTPAELALQNALKYGRALHADYVHDERSDVQMLFKRTFALVAYNDPLEAGGEESRFAGQRAREELAAELNRYILASQGRKTQPILEQLYLQANKTIVQLGMSGTGAAAFGDVEKEIIGSL